MEEYAAAKTARCQNGKRKSAVKNKNVGRPYGVTFFSGRSASPGFDAKFNARAMAEFTVESLFLFLFAAVPGFGGALSVALFSGLVFARQNMLLLAPVYIISAVVFSLKWWTLLYAAAPVVLLAALYFVFYRLRRNVPMFAVAAVTLLSMVPYAVVEGLGGEDIFVIILALSVSAVFTFCCSIMCYAVLCRRAEGKFTLDEQISAGIFMLAISYAAAVISPDGFNLNMLLCGLLILAAADCFTTETTLFTALLIGVGEALGFHDVGYIGNAVLLGGAAAALSPFVRFAPAAAMLAAESALWLFEAYPGAGWQSLALLAGGVLVYLLLPKSVRRRIADLSKAKSRVCINSIVNRDRVETASKLFSVSDVFYEMSGNMEKTAGRAQSFSPERLATEISEKYCGKCSDRETCRAQLGGDTAQQLEALTSAALARGKATILDVPTFISSRCSKMHNLLSVVNSSAEAYKKRRDETESADAGKRLMSEQFAGVALLLDSMGRDCGRQVNFSEEDTAVIDAELLKHNIVAEEIVVTGVGRQAEATLSVRASDADKAVLARIVSKELKTRLEIASVEPKGDKKVVHLESSPIYEVAYGIAEKARDGETVSGDSRSILSPSRRRRLFAISDGMGSGGEAGRASRDAIGMIESFYRAGFDNGVILSIVNKLLKINRDECFSAVDISVIDTVTGGLDIIKLGSADSFVVHGDSVEAVSSSCPPAGILDDVKPVTNRMQLLDGDMVLMMSDGVFDALDTIGVMETVVQLDTRNPQILADELLKRALKKGAEDDCTALVLRLVLL